MGGRCGISVDEAISAIQDLLVKKLGELHGNYLTGGKRKMYSDAIDDAIKMVSKL